VKRLDAFVFLALAALTLVAQTPSPNPQASASTTSFTQLNALNCAPAGASTTTYTCTLSPAPPISPYATGTVVTFVPDVSNTAASTLNVNGLGAKSIVASDGAAALVAVDLIAGGYYTLIYDGTSFRKIAGQDGAWADFPTLQNSWTQNTVHGQVKKYANGLVQFRGSILSGTTSASTLLFTLAAGYRPGAAVHENANVNNSNLCDLIIGTDGTVKLGTNPCTTAGYMALDGVNFSVY
jgi:hypothetical protein